MEWAAFSSFGALELVLISTKTNSVGYKQVLENHLLPYYNRFPQKNFIFQQDNAAIHVSCSTKDWFRRRNIVLTDWPSRSPDRNPSENLWGILASQVYAHNRQLSSIEGLKKTVSEEWSKIDPTILKNLSTTLGIFVMECLNVNEVVRAKHRNVWDLDFNGNSRIFFNVMYFININIFKYNIYFLIIMKFRFRPHLYMKIHSWLEKTDLSEVTNVEKLNNAKKNPGHEKNVDKNMQYPFCADAEFFIKDVTYTIEVSKRYYISLIKDYIPKFTRDRMEKRWMRKYMMYRKVGEMSKKDCLWVRVFFKNFKTSLFSLIEICFIPVVYVNNSFLFLNWSKRTYQSDGLPCKDIERELDKDKIDKLLKQYQQGLSDLTYLRDTRIPQTFNREQMEYETEFTSSFPENDDLETIILPIVSASYNTDQMIFAKAPIMQLEEQVYILLKTMFIFIIYSCFTKCFNIKMIRQNERKLDSTLLNSFYFLRKYLSWSFSVRNHSYRMFIIKRVYTCHFLKVTELILILCCGSDKNSPAGVFHEQPVVVRGGMATATILTSLNVIISSNEMKDGLESSSSYKAHMPSKLLTQSAPSTPMAHRLTMDRAEEATSSGAVIIPPGKPLSNNYYRAGLGTLYQGFFSCFRPVWGYFGRSNNDLMRSIKDNWEIPFETITGLQWLGGGSQGAVFSGILNGKTVAIKKVKLKEETDIKHLRHLEHPNIIQFMGVCTQPPCYCIVMEFCSKGQLCELLKSNSVIGWEQWSDWIRQIAEGMAYLHKNKVIHRDLKSPNILITDDDIMKICDFGTSHQQRTQNSTLMSFCGTVSWMAPEMIKKEPCSEKVSFSLCFNYYMTYSGVA
uniref:Protein kinase domain-containing protein n=1 Tax=Heterorhabditis bacteriophora TaxID=37862 RepID=A0A1I7XCD6_HETBA